MSLLVIEMDLLDDSGILDEFERSVDGGLRDFHPSIAHLEQKFVGLENPIHLNDRIENLGTLRGEFLSLGLEVLPKDRTQRHDEGVILERRA